MKQAEKEKKKERRHLRNDFFLSLSHLLVHFSSDLLADY